LESDYLEHPSITEYSQINVFLTIAGNKYHENHLMIIGQTLWTYEGILIKPFPPLVLVVSAVNSSSFIGIFTEFTENRRSEHSILLNTNGINEDKVIITYLNPLYPWDNDPNLCAPITSGQAPKNWIIFKFHFIFESSREVMWRQLRPVGEKASPS